MDIEFSNWTKESVDNLIQDLNISNDEKIKKMEEYIKWTISNLSIEQNNTSYLSYPAINLLVGYYGLIECKTYGQIEEMMSKVYPNEIVKQITNYEFLSSIILIAFICNLLKSLPNL
jgi:hypothetical protein